MKQLGLLLLITLPLTLLGQNYPMGLLFDEATYDALPQMPVTGMGFESVDLPRAHSLKTYAPEPGNQGRIGSCVGWALAYGVMTMEYAIQNNWTSKTQITQAAFSGMYIYNFVKVNPYSRGCGGAYFGKALDFLKNRGTVKNKRYNPNTCQERPPSRLANSARSDRIKDWLPLFRTGDSKARKLGFIKNAIAQRKPVLVGMKLTNSFHSARGVWKPDYGYQGQHGHHAMVIVGYDDNSQTFELLNSWGTSWGNRGFIKVRYNDFYKYGFAAYQIVTKDFKPEKQLAGTFDFNYSIHGSGQPMDKAKAYFNTSRQYYELSKKDWKWGQRFQLIVNTKERGQYLYVFSVNSNYKATLHFPLGKSYGNRFNFDNDDLDIVPVNTQFVIPAPYRNQAGKITK